jgi:hypothetical protein
MAEVKEYPSNSHRSREIPEEEPKKIEKIIRGSVVKRKKTWWRRITETFLGNDVESVSSYIIQDVLVPAAKNTLSDMVSGGIEMLLFPEGNGPRTRRDRGKSYVSYSNYYKSDRRDERPDKREPSNRNRTRHDFDDIVLDSRGEAEEVLSCMVDLTDDYGLASVADLYDFVGIESNHVDHKWGWTNLSSAEVRRVRDGYLIVLPKAKPID